MSGMNESLLLIVTGTALLAGLLSAVGYYS